MSLRHHFGGTRANRDRRDQAFARSVIALAELRRREDEAIAREEVPVQEHCIFCGDPLPRDEANHPYCSAQCAIDAEVDSND